MSKNLFPALSAVLKANKISLEKEEFKAVLDLVNGKETTYTKELTPTAQMVLHVFDQEDLKEDEFYLVKDTAQFYSNGYNTMYAAKNRAQLLDILMNKASSVKVYISVKQFGADFH